MLADAEQYWLYRKRSGAWGNEGVLRASEFAVGVAAVVGESGGGSATALRSAIWTVRPSSTISVSPSKTPAAVRRWWTR